MSPTIADRLREIAAELRQHIEEGELAEAPRHVSTYVARLPDTLELLAKDAEG